MLTAVVTRIGPSSFDVRLVAQGETAIFPTVEEGAEELDEGPSPIVPEGKELFWALGAFLVFLIAMRLYLVPKVKKGMDARYGKIRHDLEEADTVTATAERDVSEYRDAVAAVRAEATSRIEAARQTLDGERADRLSEVNARIAEKRAAAAAQAEEAKAAARDSIETAVAGVAARAAELAVGKRPLDSAVQRVVADLMSSGAPAR